MELLKSAFLGIAIAANLYAIVFLYKGYVSYYTKNYGRAVTELMFCIALATLFIVKIT